MLDWSDQHARFFWRQLSRHTRLYTEMVTTGALLHGNRERHLSFHPAEHPVALQLGGSEPAELAQCSRWAEARGYDEINLNVGCPSTRVQSGRFGACLMAEPERVAQCVESMCEATAVPITVKHRIGIDDLDSYEALCHFIGTVAQAGCHTFIIHARKAWLQGLSPKQNRDVPPLSYPTVYRIKRDFPGLQIIINGGIESLDACHPHLQQVDGVMLGRAIYHNPWSLCEADQELFASPNPVRTRSALVQNMLPYIEEQLTQGTRLHHITRHMIGLCNGLPGARSYRRTLSEHANRPGADIGVLIKALAQIGQESATSLQSVAPTSTSNSNQDSLIRGYKQ
jgi:tRNA-dihydrouridine synthase A